MSAPIPCGHSVCSQYFIDTGVRKCVARKPRHSFLVVAYAMTRQYGGPEEGGWWYDAGERIRVLRVFPTRERAYHHAALMNARMTYPRIVIGPNTGRRPLYATNGSEVRAVVVVDRAPKYIPTRKPRYE